jgi:hypothetical protein
MLLSSFALPRLIGAGTGTTIPRASHGRGVRWAQGQGHGVRQRGGPRGVCLPARADRTAAEHTPRPQSSQQATCAKRADARQGRWRGQAAREVRPHRSTDANAMPTRGRWRRARRRRCRREPPPGDGGGRKRERRRPRTHLTARLCTHVEATRARRGGLRGAAEEEGEDAPHTNAPYATAPPFSAAPASRLGPSARRRTNAPRELPGGDNPRSEPILRTAGRGPSSAVSGLSRAPEGRPRMPERRPDPVLGHSLIEALRGLPEAPPGSSQAARTPV